MQAFVLVVFFFVGSFFRIPAQVQIKAAKNILSTQNKSTNLTGEWERVGNTEDSNISKLIFYPDGKLNLVNKAKAEMLMVRYRIVSDSDPVKGDIIMAPFGEGQPKDRILFTVRFNNASTIEFKYTSGEVTQTVFLKKVKDIPHGIIPLGR